MKKIDVKDKKILYELDQDSRQSLSQIGKKVGVAKSIVSYRITRLQKLGIIKSYYTVVDLYKLGFIAPRFHFVYQYVTPEVEKNIIDYFVKNKYTFIIVSTYGPFDLSVLFGLRDIRKLYAIWQDVQSKFGYYFEKQSLGFYLNEIHLPLTYLLDGKKREQKRKPLNLSSSQEIIQLDEIELKILNKLSSNSQMPLTDIGKELNLTARQVSYRIKKLIQSRIVEGFRIEIDIHKLGYEDYKVYIFLKEFNMRNKIIDYIIQNPHLICIDTTTGESHLELEFHFQNIEDLHRTMHDIQEKFPNAIRNYCHVSVKNIHKWLYLPEILKR
jgi:DNA-binding Lrp family transcriptional regulator